MILKKDAQLLSDIVNKLDEEVQKLEKANKKKDSDSFEKSKKIILELQSKIKQILGG